MENETVNVVVIDSRVPAFLRRLISAVVSVGAPIGIGIAAHSSAMQWVGFMFGILFFVGLAAKEKHQFKTKEDAKAFIDSL